MPRTHQARPLRFVKLESGCFVCLSHLPNADRYFRKSWGNARSGDRELEMFHRFVYRAHNGPIPEGFEVDHRCNNRGCCNPAHLQSLPKATHRAKSNTHRAKLKREPFLAPCH